MADAKLTALTAAALAHLDDLLYGVDVHDATDDPSGSSRAYTPTKILALLCPGSLCEARLTPSSGVPVPSADVTGATSLYLTPYQGARVTLYDGTQWVPYLLTELSATVSSFAAAQTAFTGSTTGTTPTVTGIASTAALYPGQPITGLGVPAGTSILSVDSGTQITMSANATATNTVSITPYAANYDVFLYAASGVPTLQFVAWTNNTTRATALATQNGVRVQSGDATKKLVGTVRLTGSTTTESSLARRFVLNEYNQVPTRLFVCPGYVDNNAASSYTTTSTTFTPANGGVNYRVEFLCDGVKLSQFVVSYFSSAPGTGGSQGGIGIDSKAGVKVFTQGYPPAAGVAIVMTAKFQDTLAAGYHYAAMLIASAGGTSAVFYADWSRMGGVSDPYATYLECTVLM